MRAETLSPSAGFAALARLVPQLVWRTGAAGGWAWVNERWPELTDAPADAALGQGWRGFVHPDDQAAAAAPAAGELRFRLRRGDGGWGWLRARAVPLDAGWLAVAEDLDPHAASTERFERLSWELSHRINNIFAVVGGLIGLTARANPGFAPLARDLRERVLALGRAHEAMRSPALGGAAFGAAQGLKALLARLLAPYADTAEGRLAITGDDPLVDAAATTPLALFVHEMASNSVKYGALGDPAGRLEIVLRGQLDRGEDIALAWRESGGPAVAAPEKTGFGHYLIRVSVAQHLGGELTLDWAREGLNAELTLPRRALRKED